MPPCQTYGNLTETTFGLFGVYASDPTGNTPIPLVLGSDTTPNGITTAWIGAGATMNPILSMNFTISDGGITGVQLGGSPTGYSKYVQQSSGPLEFTRDVGSKPYPNMYCIQTASEAQFPVTLVVNYSPSANFSLCQRQNSNEFIVVYNAVSTGDGGYDFGTCEEMTIVVQN